MKKRPPTRPESSWRRITAFAATQVEPVKTSQSDQFTKNVENLDVQRS